MLTHGHAGVPMEVMGLMLGEFVDEYAVQVIDVFAMPQSGTTATLTRSRYANESFPGVGLASSLHVVMNLSTLVLLQS